MFGREMSELGAFEAKGKGKAWLGNWRKSKRRRPNNCSGLVLRSPEHAVGGEGEKGRGRGGSKGEGERFKGRVIVGLR